MSKTTYGVNDTMAVKLWARKLSVEALKETYIARFVGESTGSLIHQKTELSKSAGDRVTFGLRMQLSGAGVTEGQILEGNEEALTTYSDNLSINELVHGVRVRNSGTIDAERVPFDLRSEAKDGLRDWYADRMDQMFFNQICGYSPETRATYTGFNTITDASAGRIFRPNARANDGALVSGDELTVGAIDKIVEMAKLSTPQIRPLKIGGGEYYVMFIHPSQTTSLRASAATAGSWADIQKAAMQGGEVSKNPIFTGALGMWNGVILHEAIRVTQGHNAGAAVANTRRAVLCGAQAAAIGFGSESKGEVNSKFKWVEQMFDYERELGVSAQAIMGLKKTTFNSLDFGTMVIPTYAVLAS